MKCSQRANAPGKALRQHTNAHGTFCVYVKPQPAGQICGAKLLKLLAGLFGKWSARPEWRGQLKLAHILLRHIGGKRFVGMGTVRQTWKEGSNVPRLHHRLSSLFRQIALFNKAAIRSTSPLPQSPAGGASRWLCGNAPSCDRVTELTAPATPPMPQEMLILQSRAGGSRAASKPTGKDYFAVGA